MLRQIMIDEIRFLSFRSTSPNVHRHWSAYFTFGLICTWVAGIGRYWDNPNAYLWQRLGLGSVVYVFLLALVIWLILCPLRPKQWSFRNVLLFIALTSPPAILYAIPVERFASPETAVSLNAWFLALVALWRVALLIRYLRVSSLLPWNCVIVGTFLPLTIIVVSLSILNLEHVVFNIMGGIAPEERSPNDAAYGVVVMLSFFSLYAAPILAIAYACLVVTRRGAA